MSSKIGQKILVLREAWFAGIDGLSDAEIDALSLRWHTLINRYQRFVAKIKIRQFEITGYFCERSNPC